MTETKPVSVLLADDEIHIRMLMKGVLASLGGFRVAAEARDGREAVTLYREHRPDIALMDINMPFLDGLQALTLIRTEFADAFVIMLTSVSDERTVEACLAAGAAGYIRKDTPLPEMKQEIRDQWLDHLAQRDAAGGQA